jgi:hypothetical protein
MNYYTRLQDPRMVSRGGKVLILLLFIPMILLRGAVATHLSLSVPVSATRPDFSSVGLMQSMVPAFLRRLAVGDFAIVNEVFKDLRLEIQLQDPVEINATVGTIFVTLRNLVCYNVVIGEFFNACVEGNVGQSSPQPWSY